MRDENSNFPQARSHASPAREIELKLEVPLRSLGRERLEAAGERTCQGRQCPSSPRHDPVGMALSNVQEGKRSRPVDGRQGTRKSLIVAMARKLMMKPIFSNFGVYLRWVGGGKSAAKNIFRRNVILRDDTQSQYLPAVSSQK